ncbi:MAG: hypothetical protein E6845_07655 [Clostridium sp.]|uniref:hypothetical protein n=1 Tax=Clostridium sp. TaxID=1506 RepID=UPI0028FE82B2|nr:hypothetical protein [Clostridium sp.]MDU1602826.1 hypothetical protein [Clostridium sp.]
MLKYAINPFTQELLTVEQWILEPCLQRKNERCSEARYVEGICPICGEKVLARATTSLEITKHFTHYKNTNCPISRARREPGNIDYTYWDKNVDNLKQEINDNIYKIYYKCYQLCGYDLRHTEFMKMCNHFRENNAIKYRGLTVEYIPYVLVHLAGIIRNEFFFALNYNTQMGNDLWENHNQNGTILKINVEKRSEENDCLVIEINGEFLNENRDKTDSFKKREEEIKSAIGIL